MKPIQQQVAEFVEAWGISNEEQPMTVPVFITGY